MYPIILKLHLIAVVLSVLVYLARVGVTISGHKLAENRAFKLVAMAAMLLVIISAAGLAVTLGQYPIVEGWLTEKLIALVLYIGLAIVSLKPGFSVVARLPMIALSLGAFVYAMMVAKQHAGFLL